MNETGKRVIQFHKNGSALIGKLDYFFLTGDLWNSKENDSFWKRLKISASFMKPWFNKNAEIVNSAWKNRNWRPRRSLVPTVFFGNMMVSCNLPKKLKLYQKLATKLTTLFCQFQWNCVTKIKKLNLIFTQFWHKNPFWNQNGFNETIAKQTKIAKWLLKPGLVSKILLGFHETTWIRCNC